MWSLIVENLTIAALIYFHGWQFTVFWFFVEGLKPDDMGEMLMLVFMALLWPILLPCVAVLRVMDMFKS